MKHVVFASQGYTAYCVPWPDPWELAIEFPGAQYHVMSGGNDRRRIVRDGPSGQAVKRVEAGKLELNKSVHNESSRGSLMANVALTGSDPKLTLVGKATGDRNMRMRKRLYVYCVALIGALLVLALGALGWQVGLFWQEQRVIAALRAQGAEVYNSQRGMGLGLWGIGAKDRGFDVHLVGGQAGLALAAKLRNVTGLAVDNMAIGHDAASALSKMTALTGLGMTGVRATDEVWAQLGALQTLETVILLQTPLSDQAVAHLSRLKRLIALHVCDCGVTDEGLRHLGKATELASLYMLVCPIRGEGLRYLKHLPDLLELRLRSCRLSDAALGVLPEFPALRLLDIGDNDISDKGLESVSRMENLETLDLSDTQITDAGLAMLQRMQSLEDLVLTGTKVTEEGIAKLQAARPWLSIKRQ